MSKQNALNFIHYVMHDDLGQQQIKSLSSYSSLENMVSLGEESGFIFSVTEFQEAFKIDWKMRASYYTSPTTLG